MSGQRVAHRATTMTLFCCLVAGAAQNPNKRTDVLEYAPHVRIDWSNRRVEVDGRVCLREGMLELFTCTPHTREHESIVVTEARPLRIHEALGLIGLNPGHPVKYDPANDRWVPADGDPLRIEIRWDHHGRSKTAQIGTWMLDVATGRPVPPGIWRFAGSARDQHGAFLADADGTVICVVDFSSALVAVGERKSADNDALWSKANTDQIPPIGTPVTLLLAPVEPVLFDLSVGANGQITYGDQRLSMKRLVERIRRFEADHQWTRINIAVDPATPPNLVERIEDGVRRTARPGTSVHVIVSGQPKVDQSVSQGNSDRP